MGIYDRFCIMCCAEWPGFAKSLMKSLEFWTRVGTAALYGVRAILGEVRSASVNAL